MNPRKKRLEIISSLRKINIEKNKNYYKKNELIMKKAVLFIEQRLNRV